MRADWRLKVEHWREAFNHGAAFSVRYGREGDLVGLLAHDADDAFDAARRRFEAPP